MTIIKGLLVVTIFTTVMLVLVTTESTCDKSPKEYGDRKCDQGRGLGTGLLLETTDDRKTKLQLRRSDEDDTVLLEGEIGLGISMKTKKDCKQGSDKHGQEMCLEWTDGPRLEIVDKKLDPILAKSGVSCFTIKWEVTISEGDGSSETPEDCYDMSKYFWYGGFEEAHQIWPMNTFQMNSSAYVTADASKDYIYGDVIEGLFISSSGVGIHVEETTPLYLSIGQNSSESLCFKGKVGPNTPYFDIQKPHLTYDVCKATDITNLWRAMSQIYLPKPKSYPSEDLLRQPIWCTWAMFKGHINQTIAMTFAENIQKYNFSISQLEIDDDWTPNYGDFTFNTEKFPEAVDMIKNLSAMGIPVAVWQHPFFNNDSQAFSELLNKGFLVQEYDSDQPHLVSWWRGNFSGVLDVTNNEAVEWYLQRLDYLRKTFNVTAFKFDAGEVMYLDRPYRFKEHLATPNYFTQKYVEMAYRADTTLRRQEVRVGFRSQASSLMVRMLDRFANWGREKGIKTLIPCALTFGLAGYPYILPDLIGGNAYDPGHIDVTVLPHPELFVRWLQVNVFMPFLQFSVTPWSYNSTIIEISQKFVQLHEQYADQIIALAKHAQETGEPILRPLWWNDPLDTNCLQIDSQFLLGNDLLVAPVLNEGSRSRDIYLPKGQWKDELRGRIHEGGKWLKNYPVNIDELAYFTKK